MFGIPWTGSLAIPQEAQILRDIRPSQRTLHAKSTTRVVIFLSHSDLLSRCALCGHHYPGNYMHFSSQRRVHSVVNMGGVVKKKLRCSNSLSCSVFSTARSLGIPISVSQPAILVAPYCAIPRDYPSDTPYCALWGFGVSTWPIRCDNPSTFSEHFPLGEHAKWRCDTPPDTCATPLENKAKRVRYPSAILSRKDITRYGRVSRTGPLLLA